jgi:hypothetical protein
MCIALLGGLLNMVMPPVPHPFPSPLGPLAWLRGVPGSLSTPLASSPCAAAPSRSVWSVFGCTRARVSPGLGLAPALLLGLGSPFPLSVCSLGLYSVADFPPCRRTCVALAPSPRLCGRRLPVWATSAPSPPLSIGSSRMCGCCPVFS